jgi:hypothetical protein
MITFTRTTMTHDPEAETVTPTTSTITGNAIQVRGNPARYGALGLTQSTHPTLLFTPTSYNLKAFTTAFVQPGDVVAWNDEDYTVRDVDPVAPDGFVILARIIVGK